MKNTEKLMSLNLLAEKIPDKPEGLLKKAREYHAPAYVALDMAKAFHGILNKDEHGRWYLEESDPEPLYLSGWVRIHDSYLLTLKKEQSISRVCYPIGEDEPDWLDGILDKAIIIEPHDVFFNPEDIEPLYTSETDSSGEFSVTKKALDFRTPLMKVMFQVIEHYKLYEGKHPKKDALIKEIAKKFEISDTSARAIDKIIRPANLKKGGNIKVKGVTQ